MGWSPIEDWRKARQLGFDGISAYALGGAKGGTYRELAGEVENAQWDVCRARLGRTDLPQVAPGSG